VDTLEELKNRLQESIATLISEMLRNVQNNLLRRATLCIEVDGRQFEHLMLLLNTMVSNKGFYSFFFVIMEFI
jgi:hypothetical protein